MAASDFGSSAHGAVALGVSAASTNHLSSHDLVDAGSCMNSRCRLEEHQIQGPKILSKVDLVQPHN
jgi:hypothetical protein